MKPRHIAALALALSSGLLALPGTARQVVELTGDPWPPYFLGKVGEDATEGLGVDIVRAVFERMEGVEVRFPMRPWKRALREVEVGTKDGIALLLKTPERERYMSYTQPLLSSRSLVWFRKGQFPQGFEWQRLEDLIHYKIGTTRGYSYGAEVDRAIEERVLRVVEVVSAEQAFQMLAGERVDLVLANDAVGRALSKSLQGRAAIAAAGRATGEDVYRIGLSRRSGASRLVPQMDRAIEALRREGAIERIVAEHYRKGLSD